MPPNCEAPDRRVRAGPQPGMSDAAQVTGKAHATLASPVVRGGSYIHER